MRIKREHLTALLNRLYDRGDDKFAVRHSAADTIGEILCVELDDRHAGTIRFSGRDTYVSGREEIRQTHGEDVYKDLPTKEQILKAVLASGIIEPTNQSDIDRFLDRYGDPDLMAGHPPVVAGIDTNLLPWKLTHTLGLHDPTDGTGYVNGFVLATGIRDELDWDYKCHNTRPFEDAFGETYEAYWNQPLGAARIGRQGLLNYRRIRDIEQASEIQSAEGDEAIIEAYDQFNRNHRADVILFSNDRTFVERAKAHRLLAHHVAVPTDFPKTTTATWDQIEILLHMLAIVFGIIELPNTTVYGVWRGKDELDWQYDRVKLDVRSPSLADQVRTDLAIVETYEELPE